MEHLRKRKCRLRNHRLRSGATQEEEIQIEKPLDLRGGGQEKKEPERIQEQEQLETIPTIEEEVSKIQFLEIEP